MKAGPSHGGHGEAAEDSSRSFLERSGPFAARSGRLPCSVAGCPGPALPGPGGVPSLEGRRAGAAAAGLDVPPQLEAAAGETA